MIGKINLPLLPERGTVIKSMPYCDSHVEDVSWIKLGTSQYLIQQSVKFGCRQNEILGKSDDVF